jgi:homoserine dehydrogenase
VSKSKINVGLLGMGTVGRGVYRILKDNRAGIEQKVGAPVDIKKILVRDPDKDRGLELEQGLLTTEAGDIINNPDIDIVVEVLGGINPALEYSLRALKQGKSLVTANKDMIAAHGKELFQAAGENGCDLFFEASVAGGIPIIRPLKECLAANRIRQVIGIVNGTTNYMLTRMSKEGLTFDEALAQAQALGYAEADPTADVAGHDAARKMAIIASIAFNTRVSLEQVFLEGITRITTEDIKYAAELNYVVKLLGIAKESDDGIEVRVHPALLPEDHPLAPVDDVYNAIHVSGDAVGDVMFFGRAALEELQKGKDFVYIHVEAPDAAGHRGEPETKIRAIEMVDEMLGMLLEEMKCFENYKILLLPDHPTPLRTMTHSSNPVPFAVYARDCPKEKSRTFDEDSAAASGLYLTGHTLMDFFINGKN